LKANHPDHVISILSFHGQVELWVGHGDRWGSHKVSCAPAEQVIEVFTTAGGVVEELLLENTTAQLVARSPDGSTSLRMDGRAHAGLLYSRHPDRQALEPWLPASIPTARLLIVPFVADHIDLVRDGGAGREHFHGPTPLGQEQPGVGRKWVELAWGGWPTVIGAVAVLGNWAWLAPQGDKLSNRGLSLVLTIAASMLLLGATRLLVLAWSYGQWRRFQAARSAARGLADGVVAPGQCRRMAAAMFGAAAVVLLVLFWQANPGVALASTLVSGFWLYGPIAALLASSSRAEKKSPEHPGPRSSP
jgi:hypothetical protein